ncbi:MAG: hypothetical protein HYV97_15800 [Bdellovibrio sp.]|nr:hypothetical protein [Bdellovibrio sp.]
MKIVKALLIIAYCLFDFSDRGLANSRDKAVAEFNKEEGFKLSPIAIKHLEIKFQTLAGTGPWKIPTSALVRIKSSTGTYRRYDDWITLVVVKVLKQEETIATIESVDLQANDEIAIQGVTFLRMTEADLNSDTIDACTQ